MEEATESEVQESAGYVITTKMVNTWKHRVEKGGWFRRARLVARQFRGSVEMDQTFAPTSMMSVPRLMLHMMVNVYTHFVAMTLDVKDAFLMAPQPENENAFVSLDGIYYRLLRCLPGQRTAASQWFQMLAGTLEDFGLKEDPMQPTLFKWGTHMFLTVHVDDILMVGDPATLKRFVLFLKNRKKWNIEEKGPFARGDKFTYLKRQFSLDVDGCAVRCDYKHYETLSKDLNTASKKYRTSPSSQEFTKKDVSKELEGEEITKFRSIVGRLMYISGERPDCQFAIQHLAKKMSKPTELAMKNAWHVASYMMGTLGYGILLAKAQKGQSVLDVRDACEVDPKPRHLIEVVCDADYAGNKDDRKSITSFQIFVDGNLIESRVRTQKSISLSSGESEFVAMVGGSSEGMFVKHVMSFMLEEEAEMRVRSDSSAARAMVSRYGVGRVRHLDASLLWIQQKEKKKELSVSPIPSEVNPSDVGTKVLSRQRLVGLLYLLKMVDFADRRIGQEEFEDIQQKLEEKKRVKKIAKGMKGSLRVAAVIALASLVEAEGHETNVSQEANADADNGAKLWITILVLACIGALSLCGTVRNIALSLVDLIKQTLMNYRVQNAAVQVEAENEDHRYEQMSPEQVDELRLELFRTEEANNELKRKIAALEEEVHMWQEMQAGSERACDKLRDQVIRLERQCFRMTKYGKAIHYNPKCRHWVNGEKVPICQICGNEGAVSESSGSHETHNTT